MFLNQRLSVKDSKPRTWYMFKDDAPKYFTYSK